jgi:hypothetical protein
MQEDGGRFSPFRSQAAQEGVVEVFSTLKYGQTPSLPRPPLGAKRCSVLGPSLVSKGR